MAVTIGATTFSNLTAQPFGYDSADTNKGYTAREWNVSGLVTPAEWISLTNGYNTWRNARINEPDSVEANSVGSTVNLTLLGAGSQQWTSVACWYADPPSATQSGSWLLVNIRLVHAAEKLQVLIKQKDEGEAESEEELPDLGTITINGGTLKLTKPIDSFAQGPSLELTAGGVHFVSGPLVAEKLQDIEGTGLVGDWNAIRAWYEATIKAVPARGSWFPISVPSASVEKKLVGGVRIDQYTVSLVRAMVL
jgi:hypothetical protein